MDAGQDPYIQRASISFTGMSPAGPGPDRSGRFQTLRRCAGGFAASVAALRKLMLDLTAVVLPFAAVIFIFYVLTEDSVVIEAPSVPQAVQDRGITPELLTRMLQARIQQIHAAAAQREPPLPQAPVAEPEVARTAKTLQDLINAIFADLGDPESVASQGNPRTAEVNRTLKKMPGGDLASSHGDAQVDVQNDPQDDTATVAAARDPNSLAARMDQLLNLVTESLQDAIEVNKPAEVTGPGEEPLVVAAAGLQLSLNSVAQMLRPLFGRDTRRRLTMSVLCKTSDCSTGGLSLYIVALADRVLEADVVDLNATSLNQAVDAAARHLLATFDPQPLATMYYRQGMLGKAERLAERIVKDGRARSVWAENLLGLVALRRESWTEAGVHLEAALKINPDYVPALINNGIVQFRIGNLEKAKDSYRLAIGLEPLQVAAYNNLGNVLARLCDWEGAASAFEQAQALDPASPSTKRVLELVKSFPVVKNTHLAAPSVLPVSKAAAGKTPQYLGKAVTLADVLAFSSFCSDIATKPEPEGVAVD